MLCIFLRELDDGAFSPCYLRYGARQLNILDYPKEVLRAFLDNPVVVIPPIIILMSPTGGLGRSLSR